MEPHSRVVSRPCHAEKSAKLDTLATPQLDTLAAPLIDSSEIKKDSFRVTQERDTSEDSTYAFTGKDIVPVPDVDAGSEGVSEQVDQEEGKLARYKHSARKRNQDRKRQAKKRQRDSEEIAPYQNAWQDGLGKLKRGARQAWVVADTGRMKKLRKTYGTEKLTALIEFAIREHKLCFPGGVIDFRVFHTTHTNIAELMAQQAEAEERLAREESIRKEEQDKSDREALALAEEWKRNRPAWMSDTYYEWLLKQEAELPEKTQATEPAPAPAASTQPAPVTITPTPAPTVTDDSVGEGSAQLLRKFGLAQVAA
jgi:hypothetical protein